jgi:hypothetical protein
VSADVDKLVNAYVLRQFREKYTDRHGISEATKHLLVCSCAYLSWREAEDGSCGEGTCELVSFSTRIVCPCARSTEFVFQVSGTLAELIDDLVQEPIRQREREEREAAKRAKAEALAQTQQATLVALFDGEEQVTGWVPFADGKVPVPDGMLDQRKPYFELNGTLPSLQMRTQDGNVVRARKSVQEHVVRSYSITWRTMW